MAMALSPLEIVEEDCGSTTLFEILVFSDNHCKSLVGKWFKDPYKETDWEILDYQTAKKYINRKIYIRSVMTCKTKAFKMCRKCFGIRKYPTQYLGIVAGQIISERITQLTMRSFHESGAANLQSSNIIKKIMYNLIDIENYLDKIILTFNSEIDESINTIQGFERIENNKAIFNSINDKVTNNDVISVINKVNNLLKTIKKIENTPSEFYEELISKILEVGTPYSSFVEMYFANSFVVEDNNGNDVLWRYNPYLKIKKKIGSTTLSESISPILGVLYQPNKTSLEEFSQLDEDEIEEMSKDNVYGKMWLNEI